AQPFRDVHGRAQRGTGTPAFRGAGLAALLAVIRPPHASRHRLRSLAWSTLVLACAPESAGPAGGDPAALTILPDRAVVESGDRLQFAARNAAGGSSA